ncbi:Asp-tRNA(Asn)/Glu-tRNA(Gln) amidotransferase subunit GatC [Oceanospirillaceae bacterium]|jgi:aspartyl-tRNA(Asn)/glutamyl-tRNA(Gln) amidotransferase subunit C|nr:Asp-tRNA(Asn)/Glu-tRNA(Gln) amidotransferase subunit GatC [Oceanospirillaceae bacterium]MBT4998103.1 Asp-tRNA(Asn)/Glu-tRNA(Gln) amidotransferase subunit GatC [Oceanospirillaceae bacterium]MBT5629139.1 Asp-tRNA(Asn)/Glu-tRNA(Gln) amidotransferase subunit GatC [Oceanospirillaceae bacterium]MBT6100853.1 Asp-tRNA(Asn)/Glu-tRNA(Gln) amidotransferase subunit GatC [Oceanospirillaceae bacterium]MDB0001427.1 Asp-tRNA(Asn)/Glu-tRNA(Gln) amidotransferase subunit GatC [Oceanospirillaceae bacterium]
MALENADIDKIAILARLQVTPSETSDYANSISSILSLIDQMQQVSTEGVEPLSNPHDASQRLRKDEVTCDNQREAFIALAPAAQDGLYLVPKVLD